MPGSFRDPSGFVFRHEGVVYRQVNPVYREAYDCVLRSSFYQRAVDAGLLVPHEEVDPSNLPVEGQPYKVIRPQQIGFISYPYEWSFSQLQDAARVTLALQKHALDCGLWLKDASAYNMQFHRGRPVFIDTLSFEPYPEGKPWVAYQQFCRHFLAPLALMAHAHIDSNKLLRDYVDGIPLEVTSRLLPFRTYLSLPLGLHIHAHARTLRKHSERAERAIRTGRARMSANALIGLIDNLDAAVERLGWNPRGTEWSNYYDATNYSHAARAHKQALISDYLDEVQPIDVWDLGANTGFFSRIASDRQIPTIAFDADPAAVEKNYRRVRECKETRLLPLLLDLMNPSPELGWDFAERMSLHSRGPADLVMALALVHHLAIGNNVPLDRIAKFLARLCRNLIIEFIPKSDSQVQRLLATRPDIFPEYTRHGFEQAFSSWFLLRKSCAICDSERMLYLFRRRS